MPTLKMIRYGIDITELSTEGLSNHFARLILMIAIEETHGRRDRCCQPKAMIDHSICLTIRQLVKIKILLSNRYSLISNMKLTIPEMTPLSQNGFPMFKPYGEQWCVVAQIAKDKRSSRPMGNCSFCYRMCPINNVCQDNGHPPALSAPLAVTFVHDYESEIAAIDQSTFHGKVEADLIRESNPTGQFPRVYILHPSIAAGLFKTDPNQERMSNPIGELRKPEWTLGDNDVPFLLNHLHILPRLSLEGLTQDELDFEEHRMYMRTILHAIQTNCFNEEVLETVKNCFPWIGEEVEGPTMM
jgi:hypothetical protein